MEWWRIYGLGASPKVIESCVLSLVSYVIEIFHAEAQRRGLNPRHMTLDITLLWGVTRQAFYILTSNLQGWEILSCNSESALALEIQEPSRKQKAVYLPQSRLTDKLPPLIQMTNERKDWGKSKFVKFVKLVVFRWYVSSRGAKTRFSFPKSTPPAFCTRSHHIFMKKSFV